jgi:hypothetical protein
MIAPHLLSVCRVFRPERAGNTLKPSVNTARPGASDRQSSRNSLDSQTAGEQRGAKRFGAWATDLETSFRQTMLPFTISTERR